MDHSRGGDGISGHPVHQTSYSRYRPNVTAIEGDSIASSAATQRYRPAPLSLSASTQRSMGVSGNYRNSYYQDSSSTFSTPAMSSTLLAYGADYGSDTRNQAPGMGSYSASMMMYNVPHTAAQQSVYDTQQFTPRQHAAMQMMSPEVASTYLGSETAENTTTPLQASGQGSSSSPNLYHHQQQNIGIAYSSNMSSVNELQQPQPQPHAGSSHPSVPEARDFPFNEDATAEKWANFRRQLGIVFQDISNGQLEVASETLLTISTWILSQVVELGLHQDNAALHEDRLWIWNDFNHAWLALIFQQKEMMASGEEATRSQGLMTEDTVKRMGDELVRLCDGVERHGLVDYQYGVWEEQIEAVLEDCLDLFDKQRSDAK